MLTVVTSGKSPSRRLISLKSACEAVGGASLFWFTDRVGLDADDVLRDSVWFVAGSDSIRVLPLSIG